jgi:hypothetical protein
LAFRCALHLLPYSFVKVLTRFLAPWRPLAGLIRLYRSCVNNAGHRPTLSFLHTNQPGLPPGWIFACGSPVYGANRCFCYLSNFLL